LPSSYWAWLGKLLLPSLRESLQSTKNCTAIPRVSSPRMELPKLKNMNSLIDEEVLKVLHLPRLPARLTSGQVAALLGFQTHEVTVLVRKKLLRVLGRPAPNAPKYFAAREVERRADDSTWLDKASRAITEHWRDRNHPDEES